MANPADPINIPALGVSRDQNISLGIFLAQALQNPDWGEIKVKLPLKDEPLSLNRQQCREILKQKILPDIFKKDPDFYIQIENLQDPENLDLLGNHLIEEEIPGQADPRTQQVREGYKLFMQNQAIGAQADPQNPAQILPASEARNTAKAISQIKVQLSDKIGQAVEDNLQKYPDPYRQQIKQNLTDQLTHEALSELSSSNGRLTDETGNLNPRFANRISRLFKTNPALRAAIVNSQDLDQDLEKNLDGTNQQATQEAYNTFRKFQITAGPQYHQLANKLSPYLSETEITRVISHLEGIPPGSNPMAIKQNLSAALAPYQNKLAKTDVNTTKLTNDLATGFQYFLNNPAARAGHANHYPPELIRFAKKMGIKDLHNPQEFQKLQALYIYRDGYSSEKLAQLKSQGTSINTGRNGEIKIDNNLISQVESFEKVQGKGLLRRWSAESKTHRQYKKSAKRRVKIEKHQKWVKKMQTSRLGWLRTPRMRAKMAISNSHLAKGWRAWGKKVENFKDNGKLGWMLAPQRRFRRKIGNWIINKFSKKFGETAAKKAAGIVFKKGIGGLAKKAAVALVTKGIAYLGLGAISGGVATIVGAVWEGTKAFYKLITDPEKRKKVFTTIGLGGVSIVYLLFKFITTYPFTCLGIALGSPFGPIGMVIGGFIGNIADKMIGGLKGIASHLANTSATALETTAALPTTAASAPVGFAAVAVPVLAPLAITFIAAWFTISTIASALSNPYGGRGVPASEFTNFAEVEDFPYEESIDLLASQIAQIAEDCVGVDSIVNKDTWEKFKACLKNAKIKDNVIQELNHSVNELEDNENLQCVGFVLAARAGENLPHQNAVAFLYNHGNLQKTTSPQKGDVAVWIPELSNCKGANDWRDANDFCQNDPKCCGHVGIVTKIDSNFIYITSAHGSSGEINTILTPNISGDNLWMYLR